MEDNVKVGQENVRVAQEGQITERFTKAIDQLAATDKDGNPAIEVRLGGIYALERIARDSVRDHWTVMEVLTAYVRKNAAWKDAKPASSDDTAEPPTDTAQPSAGIPELPINIQAILTVLGRRERGEGREQGRRLNLLATDLRQADLRGAHLEGAILIRAHLELAFLRDAHLQGADLRDAHLQTAKLRTAHLKGALNLTQEQLDKAQGNSETTLPGGLKHPPHWLDKDNS